MGTPMAEADYVDIRTPPAKNVDEPPSFETEHLHQAARTIRPTWILYTSFLLAILQPFQFGWSLSQVNLSTFSDQDACDARPVVDGTCLMFPGHTKTEWTFVVNAWIVGGMVGSLTCGLLADRFGRKKVLMGNSIVMATGAVIQLSSSGLWVFVVGRFIAGIASGCATGMVGGYLNEISPPHLRNSLGIGLQISLSVGILLVVCTFFFANTSSGWRYIAGFPIVNAGIFLSCAPALLVESPAWLLAQGKHQHARKEIARLFGKENVPLALSWMEPQIGTSDTEASREMSEDTTGVDCTNQQQSESTLSVIISPLFLRQLIVAIGVACSQQLSGVNAVFYYSSDMFKDAGIADDRVGNVVVNIMNVLPTFVVGYMANRFGNRTMLLWGLAAMLVSAVGMTISLVVSISGLSIFFTATYVGAFAASIGPLVYVVTADLFPDSVRATALSLCIFWNWASNLVIGVSYPYIADGLGDYGFVPFIGTLTFFLVFTYRMVPETAGKSSDEIQAEFRALREKKSSPSSAC